MADDTLTQKIEIEDNASAAYEKIAQAADEAAKAEKERQAASEAEEQKRILEQLDPALVKLTQSYKEQSAEMARHAKALGVSVGEYARLKGSIESVQTSEQRAANAAQMVAEEAKQLADKQRLAAEAAAKHAAEIEALDPELRKLAGAYKEQQAALQKEAQLLGLSTGELKALRNEQSKLADSAKTVTPALSDLGNVTQKTGDQSKVLAQKAGDLESSLKAVAGVVGFVSPEFAGLLSGSGEVLGGFEGLQRGAEALGGTLSGLGAAFAVVGVALAAGATAYSTYAVTQERAADEGGRVAERLAEVTRVGNLASDTLRTLATSGSAFTEILKDIADRSRVASGELQSVIDKERAVAGIKKAVGTELLALGQKQASLAAQTAAAQEKYRQAAAGGDQEGVDKARKDFQQLSTALSQATTELSTRRAEVERSIETEEMLREKAQLEADLREKEAKDLQNATKALSERTNTEADLLRLREQATGILIASMNAEDQAVASTKKALSDFSAEVTRLNDTSLETSQALAQLSTNLGKAVQASVFAKNIAEVSEEFDYLFQVVKPTQSAFERITQSFMDLVPDTAITDLQRLQLALFELNREFAEGKVSPEEYAQSLSMLERAQGPAQKAAKDASLAKANEEASGGLQAVSGVIEGSLSAALAPVLTALGPKGAIVGMALSLLEQGPEAIETIIAAIPGIVTGLISTIQTLMDNLPVIITDLIKGIVLAIPDLLMTVFELMYGPFAINIITELINALPVIIPALTVGLVKMLAQLPRILFSTGEAFVGLGKVLIDLFPLMWEEFLMIIPTVLKQLRLLLRDIRDEVFDLLPNVLDKILTQWINKVLEKILRSERRGKERNREIRAGRNNDDRAWARMLNRANNRNKGGV